MTNCSIPKKARIAFAKRAAIDILLKSEQIELPVKVKKIAKLVDKTILFNTYSNFMDTCSFTYDEVLVACGGSEDGCAMYRDGVYCILYNDINRPPKRIRFTLAHELGHIVLGHLEFSACQLRLDNEQYSVLETEANQFASQLLSPEPVIATLLEKVDSLNASDISTIFKVSEQSAEYVINRIKNNNNKYFAYPNETIHSLCENAVAEIVNNYF